MTKELGNGADTVLCLGHLSMYNLAAKNNSLRKASAGCGTTGAGARLRWPRFTRIGSYLKRRLHSRIRIVNLAIDMEAS
jgi:hypothetical protein